MIEMSGEILIADDERDIIQNYFVIEEYVVITVLKGNDDIIMLTIQAERSSSP